ncbi:class I SAM-dependent methyltransferase [Frankia sp. AgB32]|uniref:class I SAM-dependent methyltransferase n=1 Tax=Frankia sp. AgB32 TaxID=631119 RepID=UPI00200FF930|nr:class I SAM-dependent methyltransferase [Frankia sp. AgB32]MCK9897720.1 class I SAM-dependent methyltransferase [Frankia sp. AgB32]
MREGYDEVAELYADLFADALDRQPVDRAIIAAFTDLVRTGAAAGGGCPGVVADVGCGPGQLTALLRRAGVDALGVDLSAAMIARARRDHPGVPFVRGLAGRLPFADASLGGIVAWYSIIHTPPARMDGLFTEFHRVLAPGGQLLVAFQATDTDDGGPVPHAHRVAPSHRWPAPRIAQLLGGVGFTETARVRRAPDGVDRQPAAMLLCRRPPRP